MTICPNGHQNPDGPKFCRDCGAVIAAPPPICPNGHANPDGRRFCGECGAATGATPPPTTPTLPPRPTRLPPPSALPPPQPPVAPKSPFGKYSVRSVVAQVIALAVIGAAVMWALNHYSDGRFWSSGSSSSQAGVSADSFCTELRNLWDGSVLQAIRDVDNAGRAGGTPNTSRSELQTAATNAQKLADDAPSGQTGGGGDLKTELTNVAHILSAAAAGHPAHTVFDGQGVVEWQTIHCP